MKNLLYKLALHTTAPVLCGLILVNAYFVVRDLKLLQTDSALRLEASKLQAAIGQVALDLQTMETSQRGYLLTGDATYLTPYHAAHERVAAHFTDLRSRLAPRDRPREAELESVASAKIAEMQATIRLREQGYRHRAFVIVGSNQGRDLMDHARAMLDALSSAQAGDTAGLNQGLRDSESRAFKTLGYTGSLLLVVTLAAMLVFHRYRTGLERGYAQHDATLRATTLQLERVNSTIFLDCRALLREIQDHAGSMLEAYGSFLPRQGYEKVERIEDGARRMGSVLDGFSDASAGKAADSVAAPHVESLSA
jgi:CHASE3 domain sensor protein